MDENERVVALREERGTLIDANQAILDESAARDQTLAADGKPHEGFTKDEKTTLQANRKRLKIATDELEEREAQLQAGVGIRPIGDPIPAAQPALGGAAPPAARPRIELPLRRYGSPRHFQGDSYGTAEEKAYRFGVCCAAGWGNPAAARRLHDMGLTIEAATPHKEGGDAHMLVPVEFDPDMIRLMEMFGKARQFCRIVPMGSDSKKRMRRAGGMSVYFVGEGGAGTHSKKTWDWVELHAKDLMGLTTYTKDLAEDAYINVGDDLMGEITYAFSDKEDGCLFAGDGKSAYGRILGVPLALKGLSATIANISGLVVGAGNAYSELTLANFQSVVALLPEFADTPRARWFMHKSFYWNTVHTLLLNVGGGATRDDIAQGRSPNFLGYPVEFTSKLPKTEANSQVCALLGDMYLCADFGDRGAKVMSFSTDATVDSINMFETNQVAVRGMERFDINVHDVGNATATAASKTPGPVVGLITAAA